MGREFTTKDGKNSFIRSRWLNVKTAYNVTARHSLWDFVMDGNGNESHSKMFNPENGTFLDYFTYHGRKYAINQFVALGSVWCSCPPYEIIESDGKSTFIHAVDFSGDIWRPLYIEISEYGDAVRVYEEV